MATELEQKEAKDKADAEKRQQQRDSIKVTKTEEKKDDVDNEEKEDVEGEEDEIVETEEDKKDDVKDDEEAEETETEEVKTTKSIEKLERTIARLQKRIDKTTGSNKSLQKELADAQTKLEAKQAEGEVVLTEEDVNKKAEQIAAERLAQKEFIQACNRLADDAEKVLKMKKKDFDAKIEEVVEEIGPFPSAMIGILDDLDNGGQVLAHLLNDVEEMETIYALPLAKMTTRLVRLGDKIKPQAKALSKAPAPNEPLGGNGGSSKFDPANTKMSTREWVEKRERDLAEKRAAKRNAYN